MARVMASPIGNVRKGPHRSTTVRKGPHFHRPGLTTTGPGICPGDLSGGCPGDVLASGLPIRQILLEVHHNFKQVSFDDTLQLVTALREHGYRIYDISRRALELSFLKK